MFRAHAAPHVYNYSTSSIIQHRSREQQAAGANTVLGSTTFKYYKIQKKEREETSKSTKSDAFSFIYCEKRTHTLKSYGARS